MTSQGLKRKSRNTVQAKKKLRAGSRAEKKDAGVVRTKSSPSETPPKNIESQRRKYHYRLRRSQFLSADPWPVELKDFLYFLQCLEDACDSKSSVCNEDAGISSPTCSPEGTHTWFHCASRPAISISRYVMIICSKLRFEQPGTFVFALIYVDRILGSGSVSFSPYTMHRLTLTALLLASKYRDDDHNSNRAFAVAGGISLDDLNAAEIEFLFRIGFDLAVPETTFSTYVTSMAEYRTRMLAAAE